MFSPRAIGIIDVVFHKKTCVVERNYPDVEYPYYLRNFPNPQSYAVNENISAEPKCKGETNFPKPAIFHRGDSVGPVFLVGPSFIGS